MEQNSFEASDILSFDYTVDDELKDEEREEETKETEQSANSTGKTTKSEQPSTDEKKAKSKNVNESGGDKKSTSSTKDSTDKKSSTDKAKVDSSKRKSSSGSSNKSSKETSSKNGNGKPNGHVEHDSKSGSSTKPATPALVKIYVSGITDETKASDLHDAFSKHATVSDAKIIRFSKIPNQCFGLITVENDQQYTKCFENLNKTNFNGNTITLSRNSPLKSKQNISKPASTGVKSDNNASSNSKAKKPSEPSSEKDKKKPKVEKPKEPTKEKSADSKEKDKENKSGKISVKSSNSTTSSVKKEVKDSKDKPKDKDSKKDGDKEKPRKRSPERSRSRSRDNRRVFPRRPISFKPAFDPYPRSPRIPRYRESLRSSDEFERIREERNRFQKEKERLQLERIKLEREKLEILRLEREKILKEREELARRRQAVEEQRKRTEFLPPKRPFERDPPRESPDLYSNRRNEPGSRSFVESSRYDSRESRNNGFKRSKYDSDYERRHNSHSSHDRDERKDFRRDSRERGRFEDSRRERFNEKDGGSGGGGSDLPSARQFAASNDSRGNWSATVATPSQWSSSSDRWVTSFDTNSHQPSALNSSIISSSMNNITDMYSGNYSSLPMPGIAASSTYSVHSNRRF